ncbi:MAG: dynamin family protein, partial [Pseudomonadota bacterium]
MGEFSAGKSTLSNLMLGSRPLPEKVTATRLSPVWISRGDEPPYRVDVDGTTEPVSLENLEGIPVHETKVIRLFMPADILEVCDLIDFPGISDPNMRSEVWERMLPEVDAVIWCTHATQAWRQSESAVWETMPPLLREHSMLLITRYDKLTNDRDKL